MTVLKWVVLGALAVGLWKVFTTFALLDIFTFVFAGFVLLLVMVFTARLITGEANNNG